MADFCKQCSEEIFCEDFGDLAGIGKKFLTICEGCGFTWVNENGECIGDCDRKHGAEAIPAGGS
jgi:hypothetical protein